MPRRALWVGLVLAAVCALYTIDLGRSPIYLHEAEVLFALHARSIAATAHDTNGRLLPLYFQMPSIGDNVWFHPVIVYWMAPFLAVLPLTEWAIRLPSVAVGLIDVGLMYLIARRLFGSPQWGLTAAVLLALTPAHFMHSRVAMDYLYPVPFLMAWLWCLLIYLERRNTAVLFGATSVLGVGFYSYIASVIMMPLYLAMTVMLLRATSPRMLRPSVVAIAGFSWPLTFLVAWLAFHPQVAAATLSRYQIGQPAATAAASPNESMAERLERARHSVRFSALTGRVSLFWYFFDPAYLFLNGGYANVVNSTRHFSVFLTPLIVFVGIGLMRLTIKSQGPVDYLLVLGLLSAPIAACLAVPEPYAVDRELGILPFGILAATFGVSSMFARGGAWRTVALWLLAVIPIQFGLFCVEYFGSYRVQSAFWFEFNRRGAIEELLAREAREHPPAIYLSTQRTQYFPGYWQLYLRKHHREELLARTQFFDAAREDVAGIPSGSLLLADRQDSSIATLVAGRQLTSVALIPEPGDPPAFEILRR